VASREGFFVNQHLGEADRLYVFAVHERRIRQDGGHTGAAARRRRPRERWNEVADIIADCQMLFVAGIGAPPRIVLEKAGVSVQVLEGLVSEALKAAVSREEPGLPGASAAGCASSCSGGASRGCGCA
jgi:nitrogen fixation protein NifB